MRIPRVPTLDFVNRKEKERIGVKKGGLGIGNL